MTKVFDGYWLTRAHVDYGFEGEKYYKNTPAIVYQKQFQVKEIKGKIILKICSLGYFIAKINGKKVTDDELNDTWTYYSKRKYYNEYDVTNLIKKGENNIQIEIANSMYNPAPLKFFGHHNFREDLADIGESKIIVNIVNNNDLLLKTDNTWEAFTSDREFTNLYLGERINPASEGKKVQIKAIKVSDRDQSTFIKSFIPKVKRFGSLNPTNIEVIGENLVFDFGQTISGFLKLFFKAKSKRKIILTYVEAKTNGKFDFGASYAGGIGNIKDIDGGPGAPQKAYERDEIINSEGKNIFENKFTYHSFRYVLISGLTKSDIEKIEAIPVHTNLNQTGFVQTDDPFFNDLFQAAINTRLNNVHGIFEDCARERLQYGGDIVSLLISMQYTWDLKRFNRKVIDDFILGQDAQGAIPETAPFVGIRTNGTGGIGGPILWQLVLPYMLVNYYHFYGDIDFVKKRYKYVKKMYSYWMSWQYSDLAKHCIGDHGSPIQNTFYESTPDKVFVGYCTILWINELMIELSKVVSVNVEQLENDNQKIRHEIIKLFANKDCSFGQKTQTSFAFALKFDLADKQKLLDGLNRAINKEGGIINCGIFGQSILYHELHKLHRDDLIFNWLNSDGEISFKTMLRDGDQVLREMLKPQKIPSSANHTMFASYLSWYYEALGGIRIVDDAIRSNKIIFDPYINSHFKNVNCSINTDYGKITSRMTTDNGLKRYEICIPNGIAYEVERNYKVQNINKYNLHNAIKLEIEIKEE